jgi:hypothetical protein
LLQTGFSVFKSAKEKLCFALCFTICAFLNLFVTVGASGVWDFETVSFQNRTEPSRRSTKFLFKTVIRQRRIGGG